MRLRLYSYDCCATESCADWQEVPQELAGRLIVLVFFMEALYRATRAELPAQFIRTSNHLFPEMEEVSRYPQAMNHRTQVTRTANLLMYSSEH